MASSRRNERIETIRGIACLLLVLYHVIGRVDSGLRIDEGFWRVLADSFVPVRMPLFSFIAGFIFYRQIKRNKNYFNFVAGKTRRIVFPLVFFGIPFTLLQAFIPGVNSEVDLTAALISPLFSTNHLWFLQAIFLVFLVCGAANSLGILERNSGLLALFLASVALFFLIDEGIDLFSISGFSYLFPFFSLGMLSSAYTRIDEGRGKNWILLFLLGLVLVTMFIICTRNIELVSARRSTFSLVAGSIACLLFLGSGLESRFLTWIGAYSFSIYLFHPLFSAASRIFLNKAGADSTLFMIIAGLAVGIFGPIAAEVLLRKAKIASFLVYGDKPKTPTEAKVVAKS